MFQKFIKIKAIIIYFLFIYLFLFIKIKHRLILEIIIKILVKYID